MAQLRGSKKKWYIKSVYGTRTRLFSLSASMLLLAAFGDSYLSSASEGAKTKRLLNIICFESFLTPSIKEGTPFDVSTWPMVPKIFSRAVAFSNLQNIQAPPDVQFPQNPMFLDIDTFSVTGIRSNQASSFSRRNDISALGYKLTVVLRSDDRYEVTLEGHHEDLKFRNVSVELPSERTVTIRIRHSAKRTLYIALTFVSFDNEAKQRIVNPKPLLHPTPRYPLELAGSNWTGKVRILCTISATGKVVPQDFVLLECPHTLFARISMATLLDEWTFKPATSSGIPISLPITVEVPFVNNRSMLGRSPLEPMPVPKAIHPGLHEATPEVP